MNFPEKITDFINEFDKTVKKIKKEKLEQKNKEKEAKEKLKASNLKSGLNYAEKIFKWAEDFRKSEVGKKLIKISHIPIAYKQIFFFVDDVEGVNAPEFVVDLKGLWLDTRGMYSHFRRRHIKSPIGLAKEVSPKVLKAVCDSIDSGEVWECIKNGFDYMTIEMAEFVCRGERK